MAPAFCLRPAVSNTANSRANMTSLHEQFVGSARHRTADARYGFIVTNLLTRATMMANELAITVRIINLKVDGVRSFL